MPQSHRKFSHRMLAKQAPEESVNSIYTNVDCWRGNQLMILKEHMYGITIDKNV